ncbi:extracellular solute-binding protein [Terrihabitans rhizophilus]|uniref:Extracellular solute-binding protein n=1 Tax=Terrihabitans rhizophilus TaxID=3092662 RepID=A0ABU4RLG7_9HYPH|nr:extracellular solute-binding protein [Terrihabitans sp. PJ23]MDX6804495.1 extracellular solute-binding protein [Terrihabitans sp. PJ23]
MIARRLMAAFVSLALLSVPALAQDASPLASTVSQPGEWRHALSLFGEVKYPADFKHFDYVNPDAPKAGTVRFATVGTFDSFNSFVPKGNAAAGISLIYEQLMTPSFDEPSTEYGLIAEAVRYPEDHSSVTFRLNPAARWHDGQPITVGDVVWSFDTLKRISPFYRFYLANVLKAEQTGEREVTFTFDKGGNRELPQIVGQLNILPRHWWEGKDAQGRQRNIEEGTLEPPLGSGPYKVKEFSAGRWEVYERVTDHWAKDLPSERGTNNFDTVRYDYFRDQTVLVEAFKGDQYDYRLENSAKNWATSYDFPAARDGRVILEKFPDQGSGIMQGFAFNLRRDKFKDPRVRRAFNLAFDFEDLNRTLMFDQYERIGSYFHGTDLASSGLPSGKELEILESVRGKVPESVFTTPYANPVGGSPEKTRANLREAARLLKEAGWEVRDGRLTNAATGEPMTVEYLYVDPSAERTVSLLRPALQRLGIQMSMRTVDDSQYVNRVRSHDFDIITAGFPESLSPGNEQREFWGSEAADREGSRNVIGIKDPAVDALIDRVIYANSREDLVAATKALDRVLLANNYVVPQFAISYDRTARWNRFARPANLPPRGSLFPTVWWWDEAAAQKTRTGP